MHRSGVAPVPFHMGISALSFICVAEAISALCSAFSHRSSLENHLTVQEVLRYTMGNKFTFECLPFGGPYRRTIPGGITLASHH